MQPCHHMPQRSTNVGETPHKSGITQHKLLVMRPKEWGKSWYFGMENHFHHPFFIQLCDHNPVIMCLKDPQTSLKYHINHILHTFTLNSL